MSAEPWDVTPEPAVDAEQARRYELLRIARQRVHTTWLDLGLLLSGLAFAALAFAMGMPRDGTLPLVSIFIMIICWHLRSLTARLDAVIQLLADQPSGIQSRDAPGGD